MCGVLYFKGDSGIFYKGLILQLLHESRIRGLHAFGVSLRKTPKERFQTVRTFTLPDAEQYIAENDFCELIGHCRYDTSGDWHEISNNQPIVIGDSILAFNGVVRMSTKEEYEAEFEREYTTANDGEIVLRMFADEDRAPAYALLSERRVSFAGVVHVNGRSLAVRNERRPLWEARIDDARFVFSTLDIWQRAMAHMLHERSLPKGVLVREISPMEVVWL